MHSENWQVNPPIYVWLELLSCLNARQADQFDGAMQWDCRLGCSWRHSKITALLSHERMGAVGFHFVISVITALRCPGWWNDCWFSAASTHETTPDDVVGATTGRYKANFDHDADCDGSCKENGIGSLVFARQKRPTSHQHLKENARKSKLIWRGEWSQR